MLKKLFELKSVASYIDKEKKSLEDMYKNYFLDEDTRENLNSLPKITLKDLIVNQEKILKNEGIYSIKSKANTSSFLLISNGLITPFDYKKRIAMPKDASYVKAMSKYKKYSPLTKTEIFDRIYESANKCVTKSFLKSNSIDTIRDKLSTNNISLLEDFLMFYDIKPIETRRIKKLDEESKNNILLKNKEFVDVLDLQKSNQNANEKIYRLIEIKESIEKQIEEVEKILDKTNSSIDSPYFSFSVSESFVCQKENIPSSGDSLHKFFKEELDMDAYKKAIYSEDELDFEYKEVLELSRPAANISELTLNLSSKEYAMSKSFNKAPEFELNQKINFLN